MGRGRPPKPLTDLILSGTYRKDRHSGRIVAALTPPTPSAETPRQRAPLPPLGRWPSHLSADERKLWISTSKARPWLTTADEHVLEQFCVLTLKDRQARKDAASKVKSKTRFSVSEREQLFKFLAHLDAGRDSWVIPAVPAITPDVDAASSEPDPWDKFLNCSPNCTCKECDPYGFNAAMHS